MTSHHFRKTLIYKYGKAKVNYFNSQVRPRLAAVSLARYYDCPIPHKKNSKKSNPFFAEMFF